jgi:hypothetical protein
MTPPFAHVSQTALAALAAATSIWLSLFVLPGAGVQGRPIPLIPAIGEAAGAVTAPFQAPALPSAPATRRPAAPAHVVARTTEPSRPAVSSPRPRSQAHRAHPAVRRTPAVPVQAAAPIYAAPPRVAQRFSGPPRGKAKALGHHTGAKPRAEAGARGRGQGQARGHHRGAPPGQSKGALAARPVPPQMQGHGTGNGEGHGGGKR